MRISPAALTLCLGATLLAAGDGPAPAPSAAAPTTPARLRLELFTKDLAASRTFYEQTLGFTVDRAEDDYLAVHLGDVQFGLSADKGLSRGHYFNPELQTGRRGLGTEIVIEVPDVEAVCEQVKQKGWPLLSKLSKRPWGLRDFRIADPDGYYLRISSQQ